MSRKIFRSVFLVAGVVLLASIVIIMGCLYDYFGTLQEKQLTDEAALAAAGVEEDGLIYLEKIHSERYRLTWIAPDGSVLYDTQADASQMENHANRTEVRQALETGTGKSHRYSATLTEKTSYFAMRLTDGSVLRISSGHATAAVLALGMLQPILAVIILALILSGVLASRLSRKIVEPLNQLDLDHPLDNNAAYAELAPLLRRINRQHMEISLQLCKLRKKTDEFDQTIRNMREGLVLLDETGCILSINDAARSMFGVSGECVGADFLTVDRRHDMSQAIHRAFETGHSEVRGTLGGRIYQFDVSRIDSEGAVIGAVLLAFDITDREMAERNRREFTANVSHELKTPLQGIIGSAELMEKGMVKPEDMPRFVGHIHTEASRMVTLISDIIRLSQLDEGQEMPRETVDLLDVAREAADNLEDAAAKKEVTIFVQGDTVHVEGVRRLLYEVIYNLLDNGVKYNRPGGTVKLTLDTDQGQARIRVEDTGIGIPAEDQSRVFERFFRVDKSHSKASGGTGLGLSIVKHAVQYHGGSVEVSSALDKGTCFTVRIPEKA